MIDIFISILTNFVRVYLYYKFISVFLEHSNVSRRKEVLAYGVYFLVSSAVYLIFHQAYINAICSIAGLSILVLMRTRSIKKYVLVTFSVYFINLACDVIAILIFVDYEDGETFNQIYAVLEILLVFICELLAERIMIHRKKANAIQNLPLILVPLSSVIMILFLFHLQIDKDKTVVIVSCVGLLIINFLVFHLYDMIIQAFSEKYEKEMLRRQIQIYANELDVIMHSENKVKSLRHDMKYHLNELRYLSEKGEVCAVSKYIDSMENFLQNPDEIASSGNTEIDSLLNYMLQRAKNILTTVHVKINLPEDIFPTFDINVILGNLLENAIDAARQTEEKFLEVLVEYKQGVLLIKINNSFSGGLKMDRHKFLTTKKSGGDHGIGLTSVKQIVEKYNGILKIDPQGNLFCVKVKLYLS